MKTTRRSPERIIALMRPTSSRCGLGTSHAPDQTGATEKSTGRPPYAAASTRTGDPGGPGIEPSQAIRRSANPIGTASGGTLANAEESRPAAANSAPHAGSPAGGPAAGFGMASSRRSRPSVSSSSPTMPGTTAAGSE